MGTDTSGNEKDVQEKQPARSTQNDNNSDEESAETSGSTSHKQEPKATLKAMSHIMTSTTTTQNDDNSDEESAESLGSAAPITESQVSWNNDSDKKLVTPSTPTTPTTITQNENKSSGESVEFYTTTVTTWKNLKPCVCQKDAVVMKERQNILLWEKHLKLLLLKKQKIPQRKNWDTNQIYVHLPLKKTIQLH